MIREQNYPPLVSWYDHIADCVLCSKAVLNYEFIRTKMCAEGYGLRSKAQEKTRWSTRYWDNRNA